MFKVRNRRIYNKVVRNRQAKPVIESIKDKKNTDKAIEIVKPVDATPIVVAPVIVAPNTVDTEKILNEIKSRENNGETVDNTHSEEDKPKRTRKTKTQKKEEETEE